MRTNQLSVNNSGGLGICSPMANALAHPRPACEALERRDTRTAQASAKPPRRRRGTFERLDHWLSTRRQHEVEKHLARAAEADELEARISALERTVPFPYY